MAFGRGRRGGRRGGGSSANTTPRSVGGGSESPSSPLTAEEGGTANSAFSTGTFSSGGSGTPKSRGLGARAASSPNLSAIPLGRHKEQKQPPSPMALISPRSSQGRKHIQRSPLNAPRVRATAARSRLPARAEYMKSEMVSASSTVCDAKCFDTASASSVFVTFWRVFRR